MSAYTVKAGDSLSTIARDRLGDLTRWPQIAQLNAIRPPYVIYPGRVLQLPDGAVTPAPAAADPAVTAPGPGWQAWLRNPGLWIAAGVVGLWWWSNRE